MKYLILFLFISVTANAQPVGCYKFNGEDSCYQGGIVCKPFDQNVAVYGITLGHACDVFRVWEEFGLQMREAFIETENQRYKCERRRIRLRRKYKRLKNGL